MTTTQLITFLTRSFYLLVALISIWNFIRHRDRMRADVALLFGALAIIIFGQIMLSAVTTNVLLYQAVSFITSALTMSLGYLILRVVQHFRSVPRGMIIFAIVGLVLSCITLLIFPTSPPPSAPALSTAVTMGLVAYLVVLIGYEAWSFIRGAISTKGVTHWRLILVAAATGLLSVVFVVAGLTIMMPQYRDLLVILSGLCGLFSGILYYLGFAPPRWLRRAWQLTELHKFLVIEGDGTAEVEEDPEVLLQRLAEFAVRTIGGMKAMAGLWDESKQQLVFENYEAQQPLLAKVLEAANPTSKLWEQRTPKFVRRADIGGTTDAELAASLLSNSMFVIPIAKSEHPLGLLLVFMRYNSLFPDDDLEILRLLAEQSATDIEYAKLLEEQRVLVQKLNRRSDQLEEANRELEAFAYTVSHDLRAPLRAVDGFGNILNEDYRNILPADGKETLDFILQNSKQMGQLIDDLLMFSRLGRAEVMREPVHMKELVEEIVSDQMRSINGRKIELTIGDLPNVDANRNLIKQVLTNLISNAIKFTRIREYAKIEVGSLQKDSTITYFVRDNGVGFDMQYYNKLFGVFQRLQNPEDYEGTGVGLAIVQRIIRKHGGRVWAEAKPNEGATFYFLLGEAEIE